LCLFIQCGIRSQSHSATNSHIIIINCTCFMFRHRGSVLREIQMQTSTSTNISIYKYSVKLAYRKSQWFFFCLFIICHFRYLHLYIYIYVYIYIYNIKFQMYHSVNIYWIGYRNNFVIYPCTHRTYCMCKTSLEKKIVKYQCIWNYLNYILNDNAGASSRAV